MSDKSLFKSQEQHSRETLEPKYTYLRRVKTHDVASLLTCPLCNNICKEATTINQCNHTCKLIVKFVSYFTFVFVFF